MIKLFRNIRKKLLQEDKTSKYLKYAIGEIILVVIGILIALQVNNYNEERKRKANYLATIEQIYNGLELETQQLLSNIQGLNLQQDYAEILFNGGDSLKIETIPGLLFYLETEPSTFNSSIGYHLQKLEVKPKDKNENLLARNLANYVLRTPLNFPNDEKPISTVLIKENFPVPNVNFGYTIIMGMPLFVEYYNNEDFEKSKALLQSQEIKNSLIKLAQRKEFEKAELGQALELANTIMDQIKQAHPKVRLLYQNVGIVGDGSSNQDWVKDVPLQLKNEEYAIWEGNVTLNDGRIKIRENKSWMVNWGGTTFPKGKLEWFGAEIPAKKGNYRLEINLTTKTYEFFPKD